MILSATLRRSAIWAIDGLPEFSLTKSLPAARVEEAGLSGPFARFAVCVVPVAPPVPLVTPLCEASAVLEVS